MSPSSPPSDIRFVYPQGCLNPISETFSCSNLDWEIAIIEKPLANGIHESTIELYCKSYQHRSSIDVEAAFSISMETESDWNLFLNEKIQSTFPSYAASSSRTIQWKFQHRKRMRTKRFIVELQILANIMEDENNCTEILPPNPMGLEFLPLINDEETSDVTFIVQKTRFYAHQTILRTSAQLLAEFCEGFDGKTAIEITNMRPDVFRYLLRYVYGAILPPVPSEGKENVGDGKKWLETLLGLLDAADRFGITTLKLLVESRLVKTALTKENAAEMILYADCKKCALLKEAAMALFRDHAEDIMESPSYLKIKESPVILHQLLAEALVKKNRSARKRQRFDDEENSNDLSVHSLRRKLFERGLEVDGPKELLVSRLQSRDWSASPHTKCCDPTSRNAL